MLVSAAVIKVTVRKAAQKRGIKSAYNLAQRLENMNGKKPSVKARQLARRLWDGKKLPRLESVDLAAGVLGCDLSELLHRVPEKGTHRAGSPKRSKMKATQKPVLPLTNQADQR